MISKVTDNDDIMRPVSLDEQKKILIEMLGYICDICRKNNIKYTLIGGSLIGAIRHGGIIPWDDDVDIVLLPDEYKKLIKVLSKEKNKEYHLFSPDESEDYPYPFAKLVYTKTRLEEIGIKNIKNYGVYLDIFSYHYVSNNKILRFLHYKAIEKTKRLLTISTFADSRASNNGVFKKAVCHIISAISTKRFKSLFRQLTKVNRPTRYVLSNWPVYGFKKEIQEAKDFENFIHCSFCGVDVLISANYDKILSKTYGDYMKMPPVEKRQSNHSTRVYWRKNK